MKAIQFFGSQDIRLLEVADPIPADGQVLLRVAASGICGSDKWLWHASGPVAGIAGHEVAGEVIELGPGVKWLQVGDRVAVNNVVGCGKCPACRAGVFVKCPYWTDHEDVNGGFGELVVAPERNCLRLRDEVDFETGAQIFDNFGTPFSALERGLVDEGDDVLITGLGPIGLGALILAKLRGAFVIAADPLRERLELASSLGADAVLAPDSHLPTAVRELTGGFGAAKVIECSGKSPAYALGIAALRHGGTFVSVGEGAQFDLHPSDAVIRRHLTIAGSWYSSMRQGAQVQHLVVQGKITPSVLVTHRGPLAEFPALFRKVCEEPDKVVKALVVNQG
jgi:threonine dehydrogenase-like Zn-dependent dehydrogenase